MTTSPEHPKIEASQSCPPGFDSGLEMREIVSWFIDIDLIGMQFYKNSTVQAL